MNITKTSILLAIALPGSLFAGVESPGTPSMIQPTTQGDWMDGFGIGAQVGTLGVGLHVNYMINEVFYVALEGNYFEYDDTFGISDVDYDGEISFSNLGLTGNYLPFGGGFRVTGGVFFSESKVEGTANGVGQSVEVNNVNYTLGVGDSLKGSVEFNTVCPYLGVGWDWAFGAEQNVLLGLDLGVLYVGSADASLAGTGKFAPGGVGYNDYQAEVTSFENDVSDYKFYPVVKLSLTYRF